MRRSTEKPAAPQSIAAAIAFALIVVALSGAHQGPVIGGASEPAIARGELDRDRVVAAAVRAARDLLGIDRHAAAIAVHTPAVVREQATVTSPAPAAAGDPFKSQRLPGPMLIDLPPPIC